MALAQKILDLFGFFVGGRSERARVPQEVRFEDLVIETFPQEDRLLTAK